MIRFKTLLACSSLVFLSFFCLSANAASPFDVVINEIAWMGTKISRSDEWIELYNNTNSPINLDKWVLKAADGSPKIELSKTILAKKFYLLERTDDNTAPEVSANQIYSGALNNKGENLELYDNLGNLIDSVNCSSGWFAGDNNAKQTMERKNPLLSGSEPNNWQTSQNPRGGTPKIKNIEINPNQEEEIEPLKDKIPIGFEDREKTATVSGQIPETSNSLFILLIALALAVFSGMVILFLKKKIKL